jgi:hypothetical protein
MVKETSQVLNEEINLDPLDRNGSTVHRRPNASHGSAVPTLTRAPRFPVARRQFFQKDCLARKLKRYHITGKLPGLQGIAPFNAQKESQFLAKSGLVSSSPAASSSRSREHLVLCSLL